MEGKNVFDIYINFLNKILIKLILKIYVIFFYIFGSELLIRKIYKVGDFSTNNSFYEQKDHSYGKIIYNVIMCCINLMKINK